MERLTYMNSDLGRKVTDTNTYDLSTVRGRISVRDLPDFDVMAQSLRIHRRMTKVAFGYVTGHSYDKVVNAFNKNSKALSTLANDIVVTVVDDKGMTTLLELSRTLGISVGALVLRYELVGGSIEELIQPWYDTKAFAGQTYTDFEFKAKFKYTISEVHDAEGHTVHAKAKALHKAKSKSGKIKPYTELFLR